MMKKSLLAASMAALLLAGCGTEEKVPAPTETEMPKAMNPEDVDYTTAKEVYLGEFSEEEAGWEIEKEAPPVESENLDYSSLVMMKSGEDLVPAFSLTPIESNETHVTLKAEPLYTHLKVQEEGGLIFLLDGVIHLYDANSDSNEFSVDKAFFATLAESESVMIQIRVDEMTMYEGDYNEGTENTFKTALETFL